MKAKIILMAVALMMVTAANGENKKVTANINKSRHGENSPCSG